MCGECVDSEGGMCRECVDSEGVCVWRLTCDDSSSLIVESTAKDFIGVAFQGLQQYTARHCISVVLVN